MTTWKIKRKGPCGGYYLADFATKEEAKKFGEEKYGAGNFTVRVYVDRDWRVGASMYD